jgi:hypothetical protein
MASVYSEKHELPQYWFNLKTLKVEVGLKSAASYRVGPFASEIEARNALKLIADRSQDWSIQEELDQ